MRFLFWPAWDSKNWRRAKKAVAKIKDEAKLVRIVKEARSGGARAAAAHQLVNYDLEEDLLTYIIQMLGGILKTSEYESRRSSAAETLLAYYRRYRESKQGEEIRMYEGKYIGTGGYSYHRDYPHQDEQGEHSGRTYCCDDPYSDHADSPHSDGHTDTRYNINFSTKNA
jgi:hypothetical protein